MEELKRHLASMYRSLEQLIRTPIVNNNPQKIRFCTILQEQSRFTYWAFNLCPLSASHRFDA